MYFGLDQKPSCDEVCDNCTYTPCLHNPNHRESRRKNWEGEPRKCAYCGQTFIPTSPAQRYCSREENPACDDYRYLDSLSPLQYIRFHGYKTKKEFIKDQGLDAWDAIQRI